MKTEYVVTTIIALFLLSSVLDFLAGPQKPLLTNPFAFWQSETIAVYPFTAVSIGMKTLVLCMSVLAALSLLQKKYLGKALFLLLLTALLELYAIQQLATGSQMISIEWSIAFATAGAVLLIPIVFFFILATGTLVHKNLSEMTYTAEEKEPE